MTTVKFSNDHYNVLPVLINMTFVVALKPGVIISHCSSNY